MLMLLLTTEEAVTTLKILFEGEGLDFGHRLWRCAYYRSRYFHCLSLLRLTQFELYEVSSWANNLRL